MVRTKGLAVLARVEYLQRRFGEEGYERVLAALEPKHADILREGVLVSEWYPLGLADDLLGSAERVLGQEDGALCHAIGRLSAEKGLKSVHSAFVARLDPQEIAGKMARSTKLLWQSYYDVGALVTREAGELAIESELVGIEVREPWLCHVLTGYMEAHIELLGGRDVVMVHASCRAHGDAVCRWSGRFG